MRAFHTLTGSGTLRALGLWLFMAAMSMTVSALSYGMSDVRLSVSSFDGASRLKRSLESANDLPAQPETLTMEPDDVVKLTFYATLSSGEKAARELLPHQAWVVMHDVETNNASYTSIWPLQVRGSSSSVSWSMRIDRLSTALKNKLVEAGPDHTFRLSLLLASFAKDDSTIVEPLVQPFLDVQFAHAMLDRFASSKPLISRRREAEQEEGFFPIPLHEHTFRVEPWQTMPPSSLSLGVALIVFGLPWALLLHMWRPLIQKRAKLSTSAAVLLTCVWAIEVLAFLHWVGTPVRIVFPITGVAMLVALIGGRASLSETWIHRSSNTSSDSAK